MANTTAPLSEVAVANFAATILEDHTLTSLDEDTVLGRFMAREFGYVRDELLRSHPWAFAKTRKILAPLSEAPAFGYKYKYALPTDCLRFLALRGCGERNGGTIPHEIEGREILTNEGPELRVIYIKRVSNASLFDPLFARALGSLLAVMASQRVTGKGSYFDRAQSEFARNLANAKLVNSLEMGTPEDQEREDILDVRLYGV